MLLMKSNDNQRKSDSEVKRAGEAFQPHVSADESPLEFTFKAALPTRRDCLGLDHETCSTLTPGVGFAKKIGIEE